MSLSKYTVSVSHSNRLQLLGKLNFKFLSSASEPKIPVLVDLLSWNLSDDNANEANRNYEQILKTKQLEIHFDDGTVVLPHRKEVLELNANFSMIWPLGSLPEVDLEIEKITKCQEMINVLFERLDIVTKESKYFQKFLDVKTPELCAISCPGVKIEDMTPYVVLMTLFFTLDDILDNSTDFVTDGLTIYEMTQAVSTFCRIVLGQKLPEDLKEDDCSGFPKFRPFCDLMLVLRQEVLALNRPTEESDYFFNSFVEYMDAAAWESISWKETNKRKVDCRGSSYFEGRLQTIALVPCINIVALIKDVRPSPEIRRDPLFKKLEGKFAKHVLLLNDIFSLKKEIRNGETSNIILIRNLKHSAYVSWTKALRDVRDCVNDIMELRRKLVQKFPNSKDFIAYFEIGTTWMDANIKWMFWSRRYMDIGFEVDVVDKQ